MHLNMQEKVAKQNESRGERRSKASGIFSGLYSCYSFSLLFSRKIQRFIEIPDSVGHQELTDAFKR